MASVAISETSSVEDVVRFMRDLGYGFIQNHVRNGHVDGATLLDIIDDEDAFCAKLGVQEPQVYKTIAMKVDNGRRNASLDALRQAPQNNRGHSRRKLVSRPRSMSEMSVPVVSQLPRAAPAKTAQTPQPAGTDLGVCPAPTHRIRRHRSHNSPGDAAANEQAYPRQPPSHQQHQQGQRSHQHHQQQAPLRQRGEDPQAAAGSRPHPSLYRRVSCSDLPRPSLSSDDMCDLTEDGDYLNDENGENGDMGNQNSMLPNFMPNHPQVLRSTSPEVGAEHFQKQYAQQRPARRSGRNPQQQGSTAGELSSSTQSYNRHTRLSRSDSARSSAALQLHQQQQSQDYTRIAVNTSSSSFGGASRGSATPLMRQGSFTSQVSSVASSSGLTGSFTFKRLKRLFVAAGIKMEPANASHVCAWQIDHFFGVVLDSLSEIREKTDLHEDCRSMLEICARKLADEGYVVVKNLLQDMYLPDFREDLRNCGLYKKRLFNEVVGVLDELQGFAAVDSPVTSASCSTVPSGWSSAMPTSASSLDQEHFLGAHPPPDSTPRGTSSPNALSRPLRRRSTSTGTADSAGSYSGAHSGAMSPAVPPHQHQRQTPRATNSGKPRGHRSGPGPSSAAGTTQSARKRRSPTSESVGTLSESEEFIPGTPRSVHSSASSAIDLRGSGGGSGSGRGFHARKHSYGSEVPKSSHWQKQLRMPGATEYCNTPPARRMTSRQSLTDQPRTAQRPHQYYNTPKPNRNRSREELARARRAQLSHQDENANCSNGGAQVFELAGRLGAARSGRASKLYAGGNGAHDDFEIVSSARHSRPNAAFGVSSVTPSRQRRANMQSSPLPRVRAGDDECEEEKSHFQAVSPDASPDASAHDRSRKPLKYKQVKLKVAVSSGKATGASQDAKAKAHGPCEVLSEKQASWKKAMRGPNPLAIDIEDEIARSYTIQDRALHTDSFVISERGLAGAPGINVVGPGGARSVGQMLQRGRFRASHVKIGRMEEGLVQIGKLGGGAGGTVFKSLHVPSLQIVAIKQVVVNDKHQRRQMCREIKSFMMGLQSENVVQFFESFINVDVGTSSLIFEYMAGGTLQDLIDKGKPLSSNTLGRVAIHCLTGLSYLHGISLLHRDIKPSNLLISASGVVKLADFGIARGLDNEHAECATYLGTTMYMSPERIQGEKYSYKADIWSLGLSLYTAALGKFPFKIGSGYWGLSEAIRENPFPPFSHEVDPELADVIMGCLERDAGRRVCVDDALAMPYMRELKPKVYHDNIVEGAAELVKDSAGSAARISATTLEELKMENKRAADELRACVDAVTSYYRTLYNKTSSDPVDETFAVKLDLSQLHALAAQLQLPEGLVIRQMDLALKRLDYELRQGQAGP